MARKEVYARIDNLRAGLARMDVNEGDVVGIIANEIEHTKPSSTRTERFVTLLQMVEQDDFCRKPQLIDVQNRIADARFRNSDNRSDQSYVGEIVAWQKERINFARRSLKTWPT